MTRFAGDGNTRRLRTVAQRAGTVLQFEARRVRSQARARRERALAAWLFHSCIADAVAADTEAAVR